MAYKSRERAREYRREHYLRNKEHNRKVCKEWSKNNPEKVKGYDKKYKEKNKEKLKENAKHYKVGRRQYWIAKYKELKGCSICGYNFSSYALDFDHLKPSEKSFTIARSLNYTLKNLMAEIRKCRVLCANCHRVETFVNKGL